MVARVAAKPKTKTATMRKRNAAAAKAKAKPAKRPMAGRPTKYTPEVSERICQHVAAGGTINGLDKLDDRSMPTARTAWNWIQNNPDFFSRYTAACELRIARWPEQVLEIADAATDKTAFVDKIKIDTRLRLMSKLTRPAGTGDGAGGSTAALTAMSWEEKLDHACDLFRTLGILVEDEPAADKPKRNNK